MAYTTINKSTDYFNTKLYDGSNSSPLNITGVGFQPDLTWIKHRNGTSKHQLIDAVRGVTKTLASDDNAAEETRTQTLTAFGSDGFTLGSESDVNSGGRTFASWNWKAGTTSGLSGGTITPSAYSINSTAGFGIYKYTGTGSTGTIASGLPSVKCFIIKALDNSSNGWVVYHHKLGTDKYVQLDESASAYTGTSQFNDTAPTTSATNSLISVGTAGSSNNSGRDYIMYAFSELSGYSKFGKYTGNGNADGNFIYTGFKPALFIVKRITDASEQWIMFDNKRSTPNGFNGVDKNLKPSLTESEQSQSPPSMDFLSNGIKLRNTDGTFNNSSKEFIYMAFGQSLVGSNNVPCTAR